MNKVVDERVVAVRHRIMNEAANISIALLLISIFYQAFILNLDVAYYLFEGILFIAISAYITIRYIITGTLHQSINPEGETKSIKSKKRKLAFNAISYLVFFVILFVIKLSSESEPLTSPIIVQILVDVFFITLFYAFFTFLFQKLSERRVRKMEKKLDEDENEL